MQTPWGGGYPTKFYGGGGGAVLPKIQLYHFRQTKHIRTNRLKKCILFLSVTWRPVKAVGGLTANIQKRPSGYDVNASGSRGGSNIGLAGCRMEHKIEAGCGIREMGYSRKNPNPPPTDGKVFWPPPSHPDFLDHCEPPSHPDFQGKKPPSRPDFHYFLRALNLFFRQ